MKPTLLLWTTFFMSLLIIYLISSWLPTLLSNSGISLSKASFIAAMFQVGGTTGAILLGRCMDRFNPHRVLAASYLVAAAFIALIGFSDGVLWVLLLAVFGAGFCVSGSQVGANALAAATYPTGNRTTGVSWASAIGRSGSIVGSMIGGLMLSFHLDNHAFFLIVAVPALLGSAAIFTMGRLERVGRPAPALCKQAA